MQQDKDFIERVIQQVQEEENISLKGEALHKICREYLVFKIDSEVEEEIPKSRVQDVFDKIKCVYLEYDEDLKFNCLEKVASLKKKISIGIEPDQIISFCKACINKKIELRNIKIQEQLEKANIKQLEIFFRNFRRIAIDGIEVNTYLCLGDHEEQSINFSYDGLHLPCIFEKDKEGSKELVKIKQHCNMRINPDTGKAPCKFLNIVPHLAKIDTEVLREKDIIIPELKQLDIIEPVENRKKVEVEVVD